MPRTSKFTQDEIIDVATALVREQGASVLTARRLGERLGTSSKPIFGLFTGMDEVRSHVIERAKKIYADYVAREMANYTSIPYKAYGMGYIRFAMEDRELYKLLYMRDRSKEESRDDEKALSPLIDMIAEKTGLDNKTAYIFHLEMWLFIHGIATTIVTDYGKWEWEFIDRMVTDQFVRLKQTFLGDKNGSNKD